MVKQQTGNHVSRVRGCHSTGVIMPANNCKVCYGHGDVPKPNRGWRFWQTVVCPECGGDGYTKPYGWPDLKKMRRLRPTPSPLPKYLCQTNREFLGWLHDRLEKVYGCNRHLNYMHKLRAIIGAIPLEQRTPNIGSVPDIPEPPPPPQSTIVCGVPNIPKPPPPPPRRCTCDGSGPCPPKPGGVTQ